MIKDKSEIDIKTDISMDVYTRFQNPKSDNPFRRVRTEYFENFSLIARSFAEPEKARYDRIIDLKPTLIEGGRGSGKTMILKSMEATVSVYRSGELTFKDAQLSYFGVYCRLTRGSFSSDGELIFNHMHPNMATHLFMNELILQLVHALIEELQECSRQGILIISQDEERLIVRNMLKYMRPTDSQNQIVNFQELIEFIIKEKCIISEYIQRKTIFNENVTYAGVFLDKDALREICCNTLQIIPDLTNSTIYFMLDEYENLQQFQKIVVNTLIKWSGSNYFTIKIATKKTGFQNPDTLEQQILEESHDYSFIDMDYDLSNPDYKILLVKICEHTLKNEAFKVVDIQKLLESRSKYDDFKPEDIEQLIAKNVKDRFGKEWGKLDKDTRLNYLQRFGTAAIYCLCMENKEKKQFAGFDDFVLLSSGTIRYFLELCGMSYYYAAQDGINVKDGVQIKKEYQTQAAHSLSSYYLDTIRRNIVHHGPRVYQLVLDIGDIFRQKLINHWSEPEAARVSIIDPELFDTSNMSDVKQVMLIAEMNNVFQVPIGMGGIRPKHYTDVQPREYLLNRIYAPVLQYSPRCRWRTNFKCQDLKGLLDSKQRKDVKSRLIKELSGLQAEINPYSQQTLVDYNSHEDL